MYFLFKWSEPDSSVSQTKRDVYALAAVVIMASLGSEGKKAAKKIEDTPFQVGYFKRH